ncbi:hypothetical protein H0H87_003259 [Tephrocybe sp. NHM501043]|nr:hypothetical protein H0H87_003259 [Tephrocybe sp. NHM501043]
MEMWGGKVVVLYPQLTSASQGASRDTCFAPCSEPTKHDAVSSALGQQVFLPTSCSPPPIPEATLIAVIRDHHDAYQAITAKKSTAPVPWNWNCAACSIRALSPDIQIVEQRDEMIDLTIGDSDDEEPGKLSKIDQNRTETAVTEQGSIEQDIQEDVKPILGGQVKVEEPPVRLPDRKYNLAPSWIHKQHGEFTFGDAWDRRNRNTPTRRPRKGVAGLTTRPSPRDPFVFFELEWIKIRRQALPV